MWHLVWFQPSWHHFLPPSFPSHQIRPSNRQAQRILVSVQNTCLKSPVTAAHHLSDQQWVYRCLYRTLILLLWHYLRLLHTFQLTTIEDTDVCTVIFACFKPLPLVHWLHSSLEWVCYDLCMLQHLSASFSSQLCKNEFLLHMLKDILVIVIVHSCLVQYL